MRLKDKVVLVTASTRGIGLGIVEKCAAEGARVYMAARNLKRAQEIANTLEGVKCVYNDAARTKNLLQAVYNRQYQKIQSHHNFLPSHFVGI